MSFPSFLLATPRRVAAVFALLICASGALLSAQTEQTLFLFNGTTEGNGPQDVVADSSGALYGTTWSGGIGGGLSGFGLVFKLTPPSAPGAPWTESVLYEFQGNPDGYNPVGKLVFDSKGNLYGTTFRGGQHGYGTVFQLAPPSSGSGAWTEKILYSFVTFNPVGGLAIDSTGALYGDWQYGDVFQLAPPATVGGDWTYNALCACGSPTSSLIIDGKGNLYGTASSGGTYGWGFVFQLKPPTSSGGRWREVNLYSFNGTDRSYPTSILTLKSGVFYGTTSNGGGANSGTVYSLTPPRAPGSPWKKTVLYSFPGGSAGNQPFGGVVFGNGGQLYGTTFYGGSANLGTIFKLTPPTVKGDPWAETVLHSFTGNSNDGGFPETTLLQLHGRFFGTTVNPGTVFEVGQ